MKRYRRLLLSVALCIGVAGCGGDGEKGVVGNKDKPVAPPPEKRDQTDK